MESNASRAPWRDLLDHAIRKNKREPSRFLQLATVAQYGRPANRTVAFRGFLAGTDSLVFTTDARTRKAAEIERQPAVEVCWYFGDTSEQFRIRGDVRLIGETHSDSALLDARRQLWTSLRDETRRRLFWPQPGDPREDEAAFEIVDSSPNDPPPNFRMMLLDPDRVDYLEVESSPPKRCLFQREADGSWSIRAVNP